MKKEEFIKVCYKSGYCYKEQAIEYAERFPGDYEFTEDDCVNAYRMGENQYGFSNGLMRSKYSIGRQEEVLL